MTNPNHVFTLMDVFCLKFSNSRMLKSLGDPKILEREITLGNVAKENGVDEAWWCAAILEKTAKEDLFKAAFISLNCALTHNEIVPIEKDSRRGTLFCIIDILDNHINNAPVHEGILKSAATSFNEYCRDSFGYCIGEAVYYLLVATYTEKYMEYLQKSMNHVKSSVDVKKHNHLINAICVVFPPIETEIH